VVIVTDHDVLEWDTIARQSRLIVDTRNALQDAGGQHVVRL
jgi:UDP-N-acetyl-D-mannosaminuronate dehydrogenase